MKKNITKKISMLVFWSLQGDSPVSDRLEGTSNYNYRVVKEVCSFGFQRRAARFRNK